MAGQKFEAPGLPASPAGLQRGNSGQLSPAEQQLLNAINAQLQGGGGGGGGGGSSGGGRRGGSSKKASVSLLSQQDIVNSFLGKGGSIVSNLNDALKALQLKQQADANAWTAKYGKQAASSTARGSYETVGNRSAMNDLAQNLALQLRSIGNTAGADYNKAYQAFINNYYAGLKSGVPASAWGPYGGMQGAMLQALSPGDPRNPTNQAIPFNLAGTGQGAYSTALSPGVVMAGVGSTTQNALNTYTQPGSRAWTPGGAGGR